MKIKMKKPDQNRYKNYTVQNKPDYFLCEQIILRIFFEIYYLQKTDIQYHIFISTRMGGRAVECTGLENRRGASPPEFESQPIRHFLSEFFVIEFKPLF